MKSIYDYTQEQLIDEFLELGEKKFRATQVFEWLYLKNVNSFHEMNTIIYHRVSDKSFQHYIQ